MKDHDEKSLFVSLHRILIARPFLLGLAIRLLLSFLLPLLLDDAILLQGVRYTDIDYNVFTDAAEHVASGRSPYERHTYRYTPFLAAVLALRWDEDDREWWGLLGACMGRKYFGRTIFCVADAVCGQIILSLRRRRRRERKTSEDGTQADTGDKNVGRSAADARIGLGQKLLRTLTDEDVADTLWWLYNPLPINICTRGSAESFVVLLPVLATLAFADNKNRKRENLARLSLCFRSIVSGVFHGVGMHCKLYPVIYTASYMAHFARLEEQQALRMQRQSKANEAETRSAGESSPLPWSVMLPLREGQQNHFPWLQPRRLLRLTYLWIRRLLAPSPLLFLLVSLGTFVALTYAAVGTYGKQALEEGFLYHLSRVDHRHNYSMYWYWIYLARDRIAAAGGVGGGGAGMAALSRLLTIPQLVLLLYVSLGIGPYDLPFALFLQTFLFVAHNKVITAQYFTWYLCLLPLCSESVRWNTRSMRTALSILGTSVAVWLGSAFCLEMKGRSVHRLVWGASVGFFFANVKLMRAIVDGYTGLKHSQSIADADENVDKKKRV